VINEKEIALEMAILTSDLSELNKSRLVKMLESHKELDSANYIKEAQKVKGFLVTESVVPKKALDVIDVVSEKDEENDETPQMTVEGLNELISKSTKYLKG
jgi:hypothetical protein